MANYNNNDRNKGGYFDKYVNFDQFLMQHNVRGPQTGNSFMPPSYTATSAPPFNSNSAFQSYGNPNGAFYFHPQPIASAGFSSPVANWIQNSNLTPTANEFVPQHVTNTPSNSSLLATACEFIPRNLLECDRPPAKMGPSSEQKYASSTSADAVQCDISIKSDTASSASKTDSVIEALSNTHISDEKQSTETKALNSSGGAIKKVRNQDYRSDSRDRHSNGS